MRLLLLVALLGVALVPVAEADPFLGECPGNCPGPGQGENPHCGEIDLPSIPRPCPEKL